MVDDRDRQHAPSHIQQCRDADFARLLAYTCFRQHGGSRGDKGEPRQLPGVFEEASELRACPRSLQGAALLCDGLILAIELLLSSAWRRNQGFQLLPRQCFELREFRLRERTAIRFSYHGDAHEGISIGARSLAERLR